MTIKAFGKFYSWEDSLFFPGYEEGGHNIRVLGHTLPGGTRYRSPTSHPEREFTHSAAVYLLHQTFEQVLYVGQAKELGKRLVSHSGDHLRGRWSYYSWFSIDAGSDPAASRPVRTDDAEAEEADDRRPALSLNQLEAILRTACEPPLNLQGGRWDGALLYAQSLEYRYVYLREVWEKVSTLPDP